MSVKRMDNVGIVVEDIDAAIEFFTELGLELDGRAPIEGRWADGVTGLRDMRVEIAMMRTPDGHSRLELSRFLAPPVVADHRSTPVNAAGLPAGHVHGGRHRRYARPAQPTRRGARRRSGPVPGGVSALLHPRPGTNSHRARPGTRTAAFPMRTWGRFKLSVGASPSATPLRGKRSFPAPPGGCPHRLALAQLSCSFSYSCFYSPPIPACADIARGRVEAGERVRVGFSNACPFHSTALYARRRLILRGGSRRLSIDRGRLLLLGERFWIYASSKVTNHLSLVICQGKKHRGGFGRMIFASPRRDHLRWAHLRWAIEASRRLG